MNLKEIKIGQTVYLNPMLGDKQKNIYPFWAPEMDTLFGAPLIIKEILNNRYITVEGFTRYSYLLFIAEWFITPPKALSVQFLNQKCLDSLHANSPQKKQN